jgi:5S rRNA maturation endonuclease (ribonuclease M5)
MCLRFEDIRDTVADVRNIALIEVLERTGSIKDKWDKNKWHTCRGVISITGQKFINWTLAIGGGGAIDLVIHLEQYDFKTAVLWLLDNFPYSSSCLLAPPPHTRDPPDPPENRDKQATSYPGFRVPRKDANRLSQIIEYLRYERCIPIRLINALIGSSKLYADDRGNAVFLLLGKEKKVVGAELRGTNHYHWHGMAPGSRKDLGAFYVKSANPKKIVICESAIDAISYFALLSDCIAFSTSGANSNPLWLLQFINKGFEIYCGFDSDATGDRVANKMIELYPTIKRLRPDRHDWNDVLKAKLKLF